MLPLNFHQTFIPERRYIAALLDFVALGKKGSYADIANETDIPMGKTNGKVPAILNYAKGMGLVEVDRPEKGGVYSPSLTSFGRIVYLEDKYLGEKVVQWIVHINLCRADIGSKVWNALFAEGGSLGNRFRYDDLESYLSVKFGSGNKKGRVGPLIRTYTDDAALYRAKVLNASDEKTSSGTIISIHKAPLVEIYALAYGALIAELFETYFANQTQVTVNDFNTVSKLFDICRWDKFDIEKVLRHIEERGLFTIDRQRHPWIIEKRCDSEDIWPKILDDIA